MQIGTECTYTFKEFHYKAEEKLDDDWRVTWAERDGFVKVNVIVCKEIGSNGQTDVEDVKIKRDSWKGEVHTKLKGKEVPHTSKRTGLRLELEELIHSGKGGKCRSRWRWTHVVSTCGSTLLIAFVFLSEIWGKKTPREWSDQQNVARGIFWDHECIIRQHECGFFWRHV